MVAIFIKTDNCNLYQSCFYSVCILRSSLFVVLAVFEEVQVDPGLYYLVFGEALLNDGVTFVLFEGFRSLGNINYYAYTVGGFCGRWTSCKFERVPHRS